VMELQFHGISLSADQPVTLCRKPPIMKVAVVAAPKADVSFGSVADVPSAKNDVRSTPKADIGARGRYVR
jgi:hypothetical protein